MNARKLKLGIEPNNGGNCPLCSLPDTTDHFTATCLHPVLAGMRTNTHNQVAQMVLKGINTGKYGNAAIFADVGTDVSKHVTAGRQQHTSHLDHH